MHLEVFIGTSHCQRESLVCWSHDELRIEISSFASRSSFAGSFKFRSAPQVTLLFTKTTSEKPRNSKNILRPLLALNRIYLIVFQEKYLLWLRCPVLFALLTLHFRITASRYTCTRCCIYKVNQISETCAECLTIIVSFHTHSYYVTI